jgi:hypothetical protein
MHRQCGQLHRVATRSLNGLSHPPAVSAYSAGITVGGGNGNVATVTDSTTGNSGSVNIGSGNGPLATFDSNGNPFMAGRRRTPT